MADLVAEIHGVPTLVCAADGPVLSTDRHAVDLIADAHGRGAARAARPSPASCARPTGAASCGSSPTANELDARLR